MIAFYFVAVLIVFAVWLFLSSHYNKSIGKYTKNLYKDIVEPDEEEKEDKD